MKSLASGARRLPTHHITIRVPWHDSGWAVEEEQGAQRLVLCARGDASIHGEVRQESAHLGPTELGRMAEPVEPDEAAHPQDVRPFGPRAIVP